MRVHVPRVGELAPDVLAGLGRGISLIRELISTGNGSESAKCSHGSPSGNDMTSGTGEGHERHERLTGRVLQPQHGAPVLHLAFQQRLDLSRPPPAAVDRRRRRVAHRPASVCRNSQAISSLVAWWARIALDDSARPSRSDCSVQRASSASLTASSVRPSPARRPVGVDELGEHPARELRPHAALPSRTPR